MVRRDAADSLNAGFVERVGDTIRRPRDDGSEAVEALLLHLEHVGFEGAPRFVGHDELGRQVLTFLPGDVDSEPAWQHDDAANARGLGELAAWLRTLHDATRGFEPPSGAQPRRPLANPGSVWTHGDAHYGNSVYRDGRLVGMIDWEFAAPADPLDDPAALLAHGIRGPRPDVDDGARRQAATVVAAQAIADGYGMDAADRARLAEAAARSLEDAADFWSEIGRDAGTIARSRWRAQWFRDHAELVAG